MSFSGIIGAICSIGIGLFFLAGSWGLYSEYQRMQSYEGRAIAHITAKHFKLGSDGSGNYYIHYWFSPAAGVKVTASSIISKQQWDMFKVDDTLELRYDKSNPDKNIPMYGGSPSLILAFFMLVLAGVFILFGTLRLINNFKKGHLQGNRLR